MSEFGEWPHHGDASQNLNLAVSNTARIELTEITRPNVGEFNTVSIDE